MPGPLHDIRVLDLTAMVSGPVATMILADQGADVIKVEPPAGDILRNLGVMRRGMSAFFLSCNRSKRSLSLDLQRPAGLAVVKKLIGTADVFVQNFRPGAIERMGLDEDLVRGIRPDIVYVSISGFGDQGPYAHKRVYDPVIQALCGLADIQADHATGTPRMVRTIIPDKTTAVTAAQAITAALFARERTGQGQHVRLSMLDTMISFLWPEASSGLTFVGHEVDPAQAQFSRDLVFETQDGYITAAAVSDSEWLGMCRALNREDLLDDDRFDTAAKRAANQAVRRDITSDELLKWKSAEILERLDREEVPCAPVLNRRELLDNDQVKENAIIEIHQDPVLGPVRQPRPAPRFDRTPAEVRAMAPFLGADNKAILKEAGYSDAQIGSLVDDGVLTSQNPPAD